MRSWATLSGIRCFTCEVGTITIIAASHLESTRKSRSWALSIGNPSGGELTDRQSHGAQSGLVRELPGGENLGFGGKEVVVRGIDPEVRQTRAAMSFASFHCGGVILPL